MSVLAVNQPAVGTTPPSNLPAIDRAGSLRDVRGIPNGGRERERALQVQGTALRHLRTDLTLGGFTAPFLALGLSPT